MSGYYRLVASIGPPRLGWPNHFRDQFLHLPRGGRGYQPRASSYSSAALGVGGGHRFALKGQRKSCKRLICHQEFNKIAFPCPFRVPRFTGEQPRAALARRACRGLTSGRPFGTADGRRLTELIRQPCIAKLSNADIGSLWSRDRGVGIGIRLSQKRFDINIRHPNLGRHQLVQ